MSYQNILYSLKLFANRIRVRILPCSFHRLPLIILADPVLYLSGLNLFAMCVCGVLCIHALELSAYEYSCVFVETNIPSLICKYSMHTSISFESSILITLANCGNCGIQLKQKRTCTVNMENACPPFLFL